MQVGGVVDQSDFLGNTPLHVAASLGNTQLINLLVTTGADHTLKNLEEQIPLDLAKQNGHNEVVYNYIVINSKLLFNYVSFNIGSTCVREYYQ